MQLRDGRTRVVCPSPLLDSTTPPRATVARMHIAIARAGPAGLFFALLAKRRRPAADVALFEQNPRSATFGFGVVFSHGALDILRRDAPGLLAHIEQRMESRMNDARLRAASPRFMETVRQARERLGGGGRTRHTGSPDRRAERVTSRTFPARRSHSACGVLRMAT